MRIMLFLCALMFCLPFFGQNNSVAYNGRYDIKLEKVNEMYSCFYADMNDKYSKSVKSFQIPDASKVYSIIMAGFDKKRNHNTYVRTNENTVIRLGYSRLNGVVQLKINHNNLLNNYIGTTDFLDKRQVEELFKDVIVSSIAMNR